MPHHMCMCVCDFWAQVYVSPVNLQKVEGSVIEVTMKCIMLIAADVCQVLSQCKVPLIWTNVQWVVV